MKKEISGYFFQNDTFSLLYACFPHIYARKRCFPPHFLSFHIRNTFGSHSGRIRVSFGLPKNSINMQKGTNEEFPLVPSLLIFNY